MRKQTIGLTGSLLLAFAVMAGACAGNGNAGPGAQQADNAHKIRVQQTAPEKRPRATEARLEHLAEGINGVKHANCVVMGKTAIVGIDVGGNIDRSRVGTIKYAVAEALKHDPVGVNAIVTADMDIYHRLQEIRADMANGRPIQGIAEELADIVGRIIPQLPADTLERNQAPNPKATTQEQGAEKAKAENRSSSTRP